MPYNKNGNLRYDSIGRSFNADYHTVVKVVFVREEFIEKGKDFYHKSFLLAIDWF
jgi:hypothetical protein